MDPASFRLLQANLLLNLEGTAPLLLNAARGDAIGEAVIGLSPDNLGDHGVRSLASGTTACGSVGAGDGCAGEAGLAFAGLYREEIGQLARVQMTTPDRIEGGTSRASTALHFSGSIPRATRGTSSQAPRGSCRDRGIAAPRWCASSGLTASSAREGRIACPSASQAARRSRHPGTRLVHGVHANAGHPWARRPLQAPAGRRFEWRAAVHGWGRCRGGDCR
jgi:hypothetical protein